MLEQTLTIRLPETSVRRLQRAAELTHRPVDDVIASAIDTTLPPFDDVAPDISDELAAMNLLGDEALWVAANPSPSTFDTARLAQLNRLAGERTLSLGEASEKTLLLNAHRRSVLRRAQALALLHQRGHVFSVDSLMRDLPDDDDPLEDSEDAA